MTSCIRRFATTFIVALMLAPTAQADWRTVILGEDGDGPLIAIVNSGFSGLGMLCVDGQPNVFVEIGDGASGETRSAFFKIKVDERPYSISGSRYFHPSWRIGAASQDLISALRTGGSATASSEDFPDVGFSLSGSSKAITHAIASCASGLGSHAPLKARIEAEVRESCDGGRFEVKDTACIRADLDRDGQPDLVMDWDGAGCLDTDMGRGAGNCGRVMCSISVALSSDAEIRTLLGMSPTIVTAKGVYRLSTTHMGSMCGDRGGCCDVLRRWNGERLVEGG